jgi:hypothetical protein
VRSVRPLINLMKDIVTRARRLLGCDIRGAAVLAKLKPDGDLAVRHPAFVRFFERAKLRWCPSKAALFCSLIVPDRGRQIRYLVGFSVPCK